MVGWDVMVTILKPAATQLFANDTDVFLSLLFFVCMCACVCVCGYFELNCVFVMTSVLSDFVVPAVSFSMCISRYKEWCIIIRA